MAANSHRGNQMCTTTKQMVNQPAFEKMGKSFAGWTIFRTSNSNFQKFEENYKK
jgi:hypothetical protein